MIDLSRQVENTVKDALARACQAQGIDKSEVGYAVGGGGALAPVMVRNRETGETAIADFAPTWQITVSVRSRLLGREPVAGSRPVHDVLPTRAEVEPVVSKLLSDMVMIREQQFRGGK